MAQRRAQRRRSGGGLRATPFPCAPFFSRRCFSFGFHANRKPTKMMAESMLYRMHSHNKVEGVKVNPKLFREAYSSKYGLVRIYEILNVDQESKKWLADPANRSCDRPGSWYCPGNYPPVPGIAPPKTHANINYDKNTVIEDHDLA